MSIQEAFTPMQAVVDYVRALGCHVDEIQRVSADSVAWRGARFTAVPLTDERAAR